MNELVLSIGSNSADSQIRMKTCVEWLRTILTEIKISTIYETQAINGIDNAYLNCVVYGEIKAGYDESYSIMKQFEIDNGRTKKSKIIGSIPIDIDIVIWNKKIIREQDYKQLYFQIGWKQLNNKTDGKY